MTAKMKCAICGAELFWCPSQRHWGTFEAGPRGDYGCPWSSDPFVHTHYPKPVDISDYVAQVEEVK